jgi:hypothetical protein
VSQSLIECCHAVAKDLDLHQAPPHVGPSSVPHLLWQAIDHCSKAFWPLRNAEQDPLVHDVELEELHESLSIAKT